jgi:hypothetical protein
MIDWSRKRTLLAGAGLILITNAIALIGAAYNRRPPPESSLHLTQREVRPSYAPWGVRENSGMAVAVHWRLASGAGEELDDLGYDYGPYDGSPDWLDGAKLRELGFDVSDVEDMDRRSNAYRRQLPREALLVLEYDGPAYQRSLQRSREHAAREEQLRVANPGRKEFEERAERAKEHAQREERDNSRLFVIDAGRDARALREKYPDLSRYAVVHGRVRLYVGQVAQKPRLTGYVSGLGIDEINVPKPFRAVFDGSPEHRFASHPTWPYEVTIAIGRRLEPWIAAASRTGSN